MLPNFLSPARNLPILLLFIGWGASTAQANEPLQFNQDIRPLLSQACFRCHGFDSKTREASLRLDVAEDAHAPRDYGLAPIKPGSPEESLIWERITSSDPDLVMPPPSSNRQLSDEEKAVLKQWIQEGAAYEKHWSFEPIPSLDSPIDIDEELEIAIRNQSLQTTEIADPVTRVRRLSIALTGLPPQPAEVASLTQDPSQTNFERLVDFYLASPQFGEEMAKYWLDLARYGDTHGLHLDNERTMWAYRDWVIRAFNDNLPYDQFTVAQIAGDLLPSPTQDQWIATGFNRCNVTTGEGGAIDDEFLYRYAVDRTSTTVQTWLGLTAGCAVCHDHKYDPLSTKEFYSLYAFFYSNSDPAMDGNVAETNPFRTIPSEEQSKTLAQWQQVERESLDRLQTLASKPQSRLPKTLSTTQVPGSEKPGSEKVVGSQVWIDDELPIQSNRYNTSRNKEVWRAEPHAPMGRRVLYQSFGDRFEQSVSGGWPALHIPEAGKLLFWVRPDRFEPPKAITISIRAGDKSQRWVWANSLDEGKTVDGGLTQTTGRMPIPGQWTQVVVDLQEFPQQSEVQELKIGLFGGNCSWDGFMATGGLQGLLAGDLNTWWNLQKGKSVPFASEELKNAIKEGPESESGKNLLSQVENYYYAFVSPNVTAELLAIRDTWRRARIEVAVAQTAIPGTLVFTDLGSPRKTFVMTRGQYDAPGEEVEPGFPAVLPTLPLDGQRRLNRLDLANWLVAPENPLVSRVAVNRFWQQIFGTGIVKSSDDFGSQGTPPTHPKLLDGLSDEFRKNGWNVKQLIKRMVLTDAFQRASRWDAEAATRDPENVWLARGPRMRMDAEQIRDNILAVSGLLNPEMGGAGFKSYQPPNIWEPIGYGDSNTRYYIQDHGDSIYKRTVYAFIKRTAPPPFMTNFDAPNREQFCSKRDRSNTPLQALQLMNDIQYLEAARYLAETVEGAGTETPNSHDNPSNLPEAKISQVFRLSLGREPTPTEQLALNTAYSKFRTRLESSPEDAGKIAAWGEKPRLGNGNDLDVASLALLINVIFNLDEFVCRN